MESTLGLCYTHFIRVDTLPTVESFRSLTIRFQVGHSYIVSKVVKQT